jgi:hypothetical protein
MASATARRPRGSGRRTAPSCSGARPTRRCGPPWRSRSGSGPSTSTPSSSSPRSSSSRAASPPCTPSPLLPLRLFCPVLGAAPDRVNQLLLACHPPLLLLMLQGPGHAALLHVRACQRQEQIGPQDRQVLFLVLRFVHSCYSFFFSPAEERIAESGVWMTRASAGS